MSESRTGVGKWSSTVQNWLQTLASVATVGALAFTAVQANAALQQNVTAQQQKTTETLGQAVEQLASEKISVRILGVHALGRVFRESPDDRQAIVAGLSRFVQDRSAENPQTTRYPWIGPEEDVQRAITVLSSSAGQELSANIDLINVNMTGARLEKANLSHAQLIGTNLTYVRADSANLAGAYLMDAKLVTAEMPYSNLAGASLDHADLTGVQLSRANLNGARLFLANPSGATFDGARFVGANLAGANLSGSYLGGADLTRADLTGANLLGVTGLSQHQIDSACVNASTKLPPGLKAPREMRAECVNGPGTVFS
ncbi:pentapeptide repeat-containing protein [Saccharopolyspora endophytica]|uniref:Pentapeptide repeat-containing protein n=1 Tax=Saccharopolyspora endophytica TaxID=543886 RepID=A0ABS5DHZ8_9PSEU|nr:pentapeptide repeat-containing protein [Saccharopolyspora endophytica]MBQ0925915.1 pentapeptide repeat-containing protein [Saccharopolyspora endophytica]